MDKAIRLLSPHLYKYKIIIEQKKLWQTPLSTLLLLPVSVISAWRAETGRTCILRFVGDSRSSCVTFARLLVNRCTVKLKPKTLIKMTTMIVMMWSAGSRKRSFEGWWRRWVRVLPSIIRRKAVWDRQVPRLLVVRCPESIGLRLPAVTTARQTSWNTSCPNSISSSATFSPKRSVDDICFRFCDTV